MKCRRSTMTPRTPNHQRDDQLPIRLSGRACPGCPVPAMISSTPASSSGSATERPRAEPAGDQFRHDVQRRWAATITTLPQGRSYSIWICWNTWAGTDSAKTLNALQRATAQYFDLHYGGNDPTYAAELNQMRVQSLSELDSVFTYYSPYFPIFQTVLWSPYRYTPRRVGHVLDRCSG